MNTTPPITLKAGATRTLQPLADPAGPNNAAAHLDAVENLMLELATESAVAETQIHQSLREHFAAGGKRIRALMALTVGQSLAINAPSRLAIAACCELLHNASLIHDDIQDADDTRRDQPSLWASYGTDLAICAGDDLISAAYAALAHTDTPSALPDLIKQTHKAISRTVAGQTADLAQTGLALDDITLYETIAGEKSGPLLGLPVSLCLLVAGHQDQLDRVKRIERLVAIAYQFVDDIGDWQDDQAQGSLNGVLVLARAQKTTPIAAINEAAALTRRHLLHAREQAKSLPHGSGAVFIDLADRLDAKLTRELSLAS
ncbi:MAG: polyprenyl synthetase family protein [Pseudomonadota bacterium]